LEERIEQVKRVARLVGCELVRNAQWADRVLHAAFFGVRYPQPSVAVCPLRVLHDRRGIQCFLVPEVLYPSAKMDCEQREIHEPNERERRSPTSERIIEVNG
jgi:hypothetical protein